MNDVKNKAFSSFTPAFLSAAYNFPRMEVSVTTEWVKSLKLYYASNTKMFMVAGNNFKYKKSGEYKTTHLRTPYRLIVLLLNKIYGRANGKFYKFGWIPLIYHIAMKVTVFNWDDIIAKNLSTSIKAAQEGLCLNKS